MACVLLTSAPSEPSVAEASGANNVIVFPFETSVSVGVGVKADVFAADVFPVAVDEDVTEA